MPRTIRTPEHGPDDPRDHEDPRDHDGPRDHSGPRGHGNHGRPSSRPGARGGAPQRGIPDSLLVGTLAFLLGTTFLAWTATGLGGLLTHGSWPTDVTFSRTPLAMRSLLSDPRDLPTAWPATPPAELPGHGVFWGLLISQLLVLAVLTFFALSAYTRWRTPAPVSYTHL